MQTSDPVPLKLISWFDIGDLTSHIEQQINSIWKPDLIVGLTRGGLLLAVLLSHRFGIPMETLRVSLRDTLLPQETNQAIIDLAASGKHILIVDDINDTGETIAWIRNNWNENAEGKTIAWAESVRIAVLVNNVTSAETVDYYGMEINKAVDPAWIVFPWETQAA